MQIPGVDGLDGLAVQLAVGKGEKARHNGLAELGFGQ